MAASLILAPLAASSGVAWAASLIVMPIGYFALVRLVERRSIHLNQTYRAVLIGDPLLAVAIAVGVQSFPDGRLPAVWTHGGLTPAVASAWLLLAIGQWIREVRTQAFNTSQALSPSKIWHQAVAIPLLGTWLTVAVSSLASSRSPLPIVIAATCIVGWLATLMYDSRHIRLGHAPFDWRHLRADFTPGQPPSRTLTAHADREAAES